MPAKPPIPTAVEAARVWADALEQRAIDYAIGGALALGQWAEPRGTLDVDLTIFLDPRAPTQVVRIAQEIGCSVSSKEAIESFLNQGEASVSYKGRRVDVFLPTLEFHNEAQRRRVKLPLEGRPAWFFSAEDLTVFKMMFFRTKDIADIEAILIHQRRAFDGAYVRTWLVRMFGEHDPRGVDWDRLWKAAQEDRLGRERFPHPGPPGG